MSFVKSADVIKNLKSYLNSRADKARGPRPGAGGAGACARLGSCLKCVRAATVRLESAGLGWDACGCVCDGASPCRPASAARLRQVT